MRMLSNPFILMQTVVRAGNTVVLDAKNTHIRNIRVGTVIKLDVMVCTRWTFGFASMKQVRFSAGRDSEWSSRFRRACKAGNIVQRCNKNIMRCQMRKEMRLTEKRSESRTQKQADSKGERSMKRHTCRSETGAHTA